MDISGHERNVPAAPDSAYAPIDRADQHREIVQAVKALNGTEMFGQENQLSFQRDVRSQRMVIRIVNRKTGEVVGQIPEELILELAEDLKRAEP